MGPLDKITGRTKKAAGDLAGDAAGGSGRQRAAAGGAGSSRAAAELAGLLGWRVVRFPVGRRVSPFLGNLR